LFGCGPTKHTYNGEYELVSGVAKNSYDQVVIEEVLNFNCEECYKFFVLGNEKIKERYGNKVKLVPLPVTFGKQTEYPIRLFIIAEKTGLSNDVIKELFIQSIQNDRDVFDEKVVLEVANKFKIKEQYLADKNAEWVNKIYLKNDYKAIRYQISRTPALIIEQQIKASGSDLENIYSLVDDLLKD
jgi:predicted DsbA family dithiol-disulfide isomerase